MVITKRGIVATSQTLASQAGAQVLARGGSAMDAAIAANAVLAVVEPMSDGIGGDLFAIYREARTGRLSGINASGWSPKNLTLSRIKEKGHTVMPSTGILSVTVPGCVDGWEKLHKRFGRLPWKEVLAPAIYYAENGFPVTEWIAQHWLDTVGKLKSDEYARRTFLINDESPKVGHVFRNPDLARALRLLAEAGADAFYKGEIAKAIVATSRKLDGLLEMGDLRDYDAEWVEPVSTTYRGWKVYELPPNGMGVAALEMLNIMERFPLANYEPMSADAFHIKMEAQKIAYADLSRYLGDPRFSPIPVKTMLSKSYAEQRASGISMEKATCNPDPGVMMSRAGDTVYLTVVDSDGNIASLIQSVYLSWGSGVTVEGFGFHLQNRGGLFVLEEGHPNVAGPRKRPLHTILPAMMEKDGVYIGFGIMGGLNQAQAHAQFVSNVVDHGMNIQAALEAPRFTKLDFGGCNAYIESRVPESVRNDLTRRGHALNVEGAYSSTMGGGQAVMHNSRTGVNYGASSPRKDGAAVPEPDPYFAAPAAYSRKR